MSKEVNDIEKNYQRFLNVAEKLLLESHKEKYGITDAHYLCDSAIFNTETDEILRLYQICDLLNEQDQKISDLEAKLAEKEKEIESLKTDWNKHCDYLGECIVKYDDDEDVNGIYSEILSKVNEIRKYDYKYNQDKISFAVAYLEIIKAFIIDKEFYFTGEDYSTVYVEDITEEIDNQIKQLKEGK